MRTTQLIFCNLSMDSVVFAIFSSYANRPVPVAWQESDARMVKNAAEVQLRSFDTKIHKVCIQVDLQVKLF